MIDIKHTEMAWKRITELEFECSKALEELGLLRGDALKEYERAVCAEARVSELEAALAASQAECKRIDKSRDNEYQRYMVQKDRAEMRESRCERLLKERSDWQDKAKWLHAKYINEEAKVADQMDRAESAEARVAELEASLSRGNGRAR